MYMSTGGLDEYWRVGTVDEYCRIEIEEKNEMREEPLVPETYVYI